MEEIFKNPAEPQTVILAKELRRNQSDAEQILWTALRNRQLGNLKFRRQHPVGHYIIDFVCLDEKLIIEIDGGQHNESMVKEKDDQRRKWLESEGYQVIRFWNQDILENLEGSVFRIRETIQKRQSLI